MSAGTLTLTAELRKYLLEHGVREDPLLAELRAETAQLPEARMQISPEQGALMAMIARLMGARHALEVGTFTGYSSIVLARAMLADGRVTCCDHSETWTTIARRYWESAGVLHKVELMLGDASETLEGLVLDGRLFDLIFVDADKENLLLYHERALALLRPGGVVMYDNTLWSGSVVDPTNTDPSTVAVRRLNAHLATDDRVDLVLVPVGDGLTICRKR